MKVFDRDKVEERSRESEGNKPQYDRESFSVLTIFKQAKLMRKIKSTRQAGLVTDGPARFGFDILAVCS